MPATQSAADPERGRPRPARGHAGPCDGREGPGHQPHHRVSHPAAAHEGKPELARTIIDGAAVDPARPTSGPDTIRAVSGGKADAGVVYYSLAVAARNELDIIRFPASVNLSDKIRNAAVVPGTARNGKLAVEFVAFLLSAQGQKILQETGQPPVVPAIRKGSVPAEIR